MADNKTLCQSNAAIGYSDIMSTSIDGSTYDKVFHKYSQCPTSATQLFQCPKQKLIACFCEGESAYFYFDAFLCNAQEVRSLLFTQIVVAAIGIILNLLVVVVYMQRKSIRNKVGNVLLVIQAILDLFNTALFAIPTGLMFLILPTIYDSISDTDDMAFAVTALSLCSFSFTSSMFSFALIATERYLAISRPLWHRKKVTKSWILKRWGIVMIGSIVSTPFYVYTAIANNIPAIYVWITIGTTSMVIVSVLFAYSYIRAFKYLKRKRKQQMRNSGQIDGQNHIDKKMLRLTLIFMLMYCVYLLVVIPWAIAVALWLLKGQNSIHTSVVNMLLFASTSTANPLLTLILREDFKIFKVTPF